MASIAQHYKMKATQEHLAEAAPGQYVLNNVGDIVGFIDFVSDCEVAVMLFEPAKIPPGVPVQVIQKECDWEARLIEILEEDPSMWELWETS